MTKVALCQLQYLNGFGAAIRLHAAAEHDFADVPDEAGWPLAVGLWAEVAARVGDRRVAAVLHGLLLHADGLVFGTGGITCGPTARLLARLEIALERPADVDRRYSEAIAVSRCSSAATRRGRVRSSTTRTPRSAP